jgi:hypothetical protein
VACQTETMQDESTEEVALKTGWEFKLDGSFVPRIFPEAIASPEDENLHETYKRSGFYLSLDLGKRYGGHAITIWRKEYSQEFIIAVSDLDDDFGYIYCENFPTLLEFFRRYSDYLQLAKEQYLKAEDDPETILKRMTP